jgi:hypothetical protein
MPGLGEQRRLLERAVEDAAAHVLRGAGQVRELLRDRALTPDADVGRRDAHHRAELLATARELEHVQRGLHVGEQRALDRQVELHAGGAVDHVRDGALELLTVRRAQAEVGLLELGADDLHALLPAGRKLPKDLGTRHAVCKALGRRLGGAMPRRLGPHEHAHA